MRITADASADDAGILMSRQAAEAEDNADSPRYGFTPT